MRQQEKYKTKFFSNNVKWSSKNFWKAKSADLKAKVKKKKKDKMK